MSDVVVEPSFSPHPVFQQYTQAMGAEEDAADHPGTGAQHGPHLCQESQSFPGPPKRCPGEAAALTPISFAVIKHPLPRLTSKRSGFCSRPRGQ